MPSPIQLISTDFDGTLFAEFERPPIPAAVADLIGQLQAQGAKWVINTGRDLSSLMETLARSGLELEPDALVLVEREIRLRQDSRYISLEHWNAACVAVHGELFARVRPDLPRIIDWIRSHSHARIYEDPYSPLCLVAGSTEEMDRIHEHLENYCRQVPCLSVVRNDVYARFSHEAYNKGTALAELGRTWSVGPEQTFAAGDHLNDLPMLARAFAHCLAAPANAVPAVRAQVRRQGGYLSTRAHGHGVAEAIKFYLAAGTA